jgi:anti-anti-sigma regulatory factor
LIIERPIRRAHIPHLCERVGAMVVRHDARHLVCDVDALADPDVVTIDALARLQLTVRRLGCRVCLRNACDELQRLLTLIGLDDVIPLLAESGLDAKRQIEQREEPGGVEEEADPGDPAV